MASATQRALAERAIRAASLIESWNDQIKEEMKKQNIQPFETAKLVLETYMIEATLSHMVPLAREVRELEKNLRNEKRRGRKYRSN